MTASIPLLVAEMLTFSPFLAVLLVTGGKFRLSLTSFPVGQPSLQQNKGRLCMLYTQRKLCNNLQRRTQSFVPLELGETRQH